MKTISRQSPAMVINRSGNTPIRQRWSMRKYPEKVCENPQCQYGGLFEPHDKRQTYCCRQCGTDHRNDLRAEANRTTYSEEKALRETDRKLELLYEEFVKGKNCLIHRDTFRLHKVDLQYYVKSDINKVTETKILWLYRYGTERHHENENWIYILKRKTTNT